MRNLLPYKFIEKYQKLLGDESEAFLSSFDEPVDAGFDINSNKNIEYFNFDDSNVVEWNAEIGRRGKVSGKSIEHTTGVVYSQEPSAQFIGHLVDAKPEETILDSAAAPGGKTFEITSQMDQQGLVISNEFIYKRAGVLSENVERTGMQNTIVTSHDTKIFKDEFQGFFDKVLLDAPCSGEGMFRKEPKGIDYWTEDYSNKLSELQREILSNVIPAIKPGGELVYSTCTFAPEENEQVVSWVLENYSDLELIDIPKENGIEGGHPEWADNNPELAKTARLWPHKLQGEGHFAAKFKKKSAEEQTAPIKQLKTNLTKQQLKVFQDWQTENLNTEFTNLYAFGDMIYDMPENTPEIISQMKVVRLGTQLGEIRKDRFIPSHSLALAIKPQDAKQTIELTEEEWKKYVDGQTIPTTAPKGWHLLTIKNNPTGWGKVSDQQIKNFYPKGLRFKAI